MFRVVKEEGQKAEVETLGKIRGFTIYLLPGLDHPPSGHSISSCHLTLPSDKRPSMTPPPPLLGCTCNPSLPTPPPPPPFGFMF